MPPKRKATKQPDEAEPEDLLQENKLNRGVNGTSPGKTRKVKKDTADDGEVEANRTSKRAKGRKVKVESEDDGEVEGGAEQLPPKTKGKRKAKADEADEQDEDDEPAKKKVQRKRKTKEEKEAEMVPLAARAVGHKLYIGAHVSSAGGIQNAVTNSVHIGANAFALFLKSQRKWVNPELQDDHCLSFHDGCKEHAYDQGKHVVPHGSYLVNLAHTDKARTDQAYISYLDDLKRCDRLGIKLYNIHPGNNQVNDRDAAIAHLASNINRAHLETKSVITLLENMAAGGNVLGSTFEDLRDTIALVTNKDRIGVCIDTCHAFAGGYDLRSPAAFKETFRQFDDIVGFKYLRALHINDSKAPFASHRDLHANIGTGFLGLRAFHNLVNDSRFEGLPLILETPIEVRDEKGDLVKNEKGKEIEDKGIWAREIKMLENLVGMDVESEEFVKLEQQLSRQGEPERKRLMEQHERKKGKDDQAKAKKAAQKAKPEKGQRKLGFGKKAKEESDDE